MENSLACVLKAQNFCSSVLLSRNGERSSSILFPSNCGSFRQLMIKQPSQNKKLWKVVVNCAKEGFVSELEKKWAVDDIILTEEELMGFGKLREKCKETVNGGIADLLECLEREAIMGEDEGKEPNDYNRRAQIFDKSSRVFQALKENTNLDYSIKESLEK